MIRSFADKRTAALFRGERPKRFPPDVAATVRRKLRMLDAAVELADLWAPPANRLEALTGDRAGLHSIRVNDRWRLCFLWRDGHAERAEILDYH